MGPITTFFWGLLLVAIDQLIKWYVLLCKPRISSFAFACAPTLNRGMALSIGASGMYYYASLLPFAIVAVYLLLIVLVIRLRLWQEAPYAYMLIAAGGFSNLLDRLQHGGVVDFIALLPDAFQLPIFNIADMYIVFGVLWIIGTMMRAENNAKAV
ncbi:MAG: signal peptidase II [Candidatus Babeliales bacterium]